MIALGYDFWSEWELQEKVDFDGINKLIIVYPHVTELDIRADVWSAWVRWDYMLDRNYNRFLEAMERTGLDPIPGGETGDMYFLSNGWRLVVNLAQVKVTGILYSRDFDTAYYTPDLVAQYPAQVSAIVNTVNTTPDVVAGVLGGDIGPYEDTETLAGTLTHLKHLEYRVYIDPESANGDGDGSQHHPFKDNNAAIDYAEAHGLKNLMVYSEINITKNLKNFIVSGVGIPKIEMENLPDITKSEFDHCELTGYYTSTGKGITAEKCLLTGPFHIHGFFETCAVRGTFLIPDGFSAYLTKCTPFVIGFDKPTYDIGGVDGTAFLELMGYKGGCLIRNCNQPTDVVKANLDGGIIDLENTCTNGTVVLLGEGELGLDESGADCTVINKLKSVDSITESVVTYNGRFHG